MSSPLACWEISGCAVTCTYTRTNQEKKRGLLLLRIINPVRHKKNVPTVLRTAAFAAIELLNVSKSPSRHFVANM